jgi:hypothetical protein
MLNRKTRPNITNYNNIQRQPGKSVEGKKKGHELKILEGMEAANKRNKAREFYTITHGM